MSGETEKNISGWTVDTLHDYTDKKLDDFNMLVRQMLVDRDSLANERMAMQQIALKAAIDAQDKQTQQALTAAERAVLKAEVASDKRFDAVNEFRKTLADQTSTFLTRIEVDSRLGSMNDKLDMITARVSATMSRIEIEALLSATTAQSSQRSQINTDKFDTIMARLDKADGSHSGKNAFWGYIVGAVGLAASIASMIALLAHLTGR